MKSKGRKGHKRYGQFIAHENVILKRVDEWNEEYAIG